MSSPFSIVPCVPSDAPELARAQHTIFQSPIYQTIYASVPIPAQLAKFEKNVATGIAEQTTAVPGRENTWLKCVDPDSGEIAAYINWIYMPNGYRAEDDAQSEVKDMPEGTNIPVITEFYRVARVLRSEHEGRRQPHYLLSLLGTMPKFERRGAATRLMEWGLEKADEKGVAAYVDSSPTGLKLYERMGFRECGEMEVDLDTFEGGQGLGVQKWKGMRREPKGRPEVVRAGE